MADTSPLVNLDLINKIYKTINAQINERVYDPQWNSEATLGSDTHQYNSAYVSGNTSTGTLNGLTLAAATTGFTISGGSSTPKTLTVNSSATLGSTTANENGAVIVKSVGTGSATIIGPSGDTAQFNVRTTIGATSTNTGAVTIKSSSSGATTIIGPSGDTAQFNVRTTIGATSTNTGAVTIKSSSSGATTIISPSGKEAILISGTYTDSATTSNSTTPTESSLLKIKKISAKAVLIGPKNNSADAAPSYRLLEAEDLPTVPCSKGGTGVTSYTKGDILYASNDNILSKLAKGSDGQVLKLSSGVPAWGTDNNDDTKNTAGATPITEKIYLIGAKSQGDNPQTYSDKNVYAENGNLYASAVHNAVWNDLADCIEVPEDTNLEFGYCYSWNEGKVEKTSRRSKNCIGIHSNTAGLFMGEKPVKTIQAAVAGFVLAHIDKVYPEGTPLTWSDDGKLTKCTALKRVLHPERVIATFYKEEKQESWYGVEVDKRHWVKVR